MSAEMIHSVVPETPWRVMSKRKMLYIALSSTAPIILTILITSQLDLSGLTAGLLVFLPLQIFAASLAALGTVGRHGMGDSILYVFVYFLVSLIGALMGSVLISLVTNGFRALKSNTFYQNTEFISADTALSYGGFAHALYGTLVIVGIAVIFAIPVGIAVAVFLTETESPMRGAVRFVSQSLAGLPSVVSGLFVLAFLYLTGLLQKSAFLGSVSLFLLMLPTVIRVTEEVFKVVPKDLRYAALALGASRHTAFFQVVFPTARSGVITGALLGTARIIGETAPLIILVSYLPSTNLNPFAGNMAALPTYIHTWIKTSSDYANQRAWGGALALMILVGILFTMARFFGKRRY
jgi:phosphate transport system permease protein